MLEFGISSFKALHSADVVLVVLLMKKKSQSDGFCFMFCGCKFTWLASRSQQCSKLCKSF